MGRSRGFSRIDLEKSLEMGTTLRIERLGDAQRIQTHPLLRLAEPVRPSRHGSR